MPKPGYKQTMTEDALRQRREANLQHGGDSAQHAITKGEDFTGLAAAAQAIVQAELEEGGVIGQVRKDAERLQTVADLFFNAILGAKDVQKFDSYVQRFGWVAASAARLWEKVYQLEKNAEHGEADFIRLKDTYGGEHDPSDS